MEHHIKKCERCIRFKAKQKVAPLENIEASHPMELVHIDYLTIESNRTEKDINILVVMFCNGGGFLSVKDAFSEIGYPAFY